MVSSPTATVPEAAAAANGGLSSAEAARRIAQYGPNEPASVKHGAALAELLSLFLNPLVIILVVASIVSFILGDAPDATIILVVLLLGISINFVQTYRSQQAIRKLQENVAPTATVLRDGQWGEIRRRAIVPGDLVRLSA